MLFICRMFKLKPTSTTRNNWLASSKDKRLSQCRFVWQIHFDSWVSPLEMVAGSPHGKWQSKWIPLNAKCNTQMLITTFVFKSNFSSPQMLFVWLLLMSCPAALHLKCEYISYAKRVNNNAVWGCVPVYKCGSNEVVSPVTTLAALRGSLIYHSNAPPVPPPAFYLSLPWTGGLYTRRAWNCEPWGARSPVGASGRDRWAQ